MVCIVNFKILPLNGSKEETWFHGFLFRVEKEDENATKKLYFSAALCEWLATMLILLYVLTLLPQLDGIEISLPKVTSGHVHKGFFSSSDNKVGVVEQEMTNGGINIPV